MRYSIGDKVKTKNDIILSDHSTLPNNSQGIVKEVKSAINSYIVDFAAVKDVWVADSDLA